MQEVKQITGVEETLLISGILLEEIKATRSLAIESCDAIIAKQQAAIDSTAAVFNRTIENAKIAKLCTVTK